MGVEAMSTDKEFVLAHWGDGMDPNFTDDHQFFFIADIGVNFDSWSSAAEFTRNRLEEIRQVEAEIALVDYDGKGGPDWNDLINGRIGKEFGLSVSVAQRKIRWCRILARLQAALAELKRGMEGI